MHDPHISEFDLNQDRDLIFHRRSQRWYDQDSGCAKLVDIIKDINSTGLQEVMATLIIQMTDKVIAAIRDQRTSSPISLGLPAITDLYHSRRMGRRWYDEDPLLKKAISGLYTLPSYGLSTLGFQLMPAFELLQIYSFACEKLRQIPKREEVKDILYVALHEGQSEGKELLAEIVGKELLEELISNLQP